MKLATMMMLTFLLQIHAKGFGQVVSLNEHRTPLKKIFREISKQTGYTFFYESKDVTQKTVDVTLTNAPLTDVLVACLNNTALTYKIIGKTIILQQISETLAENKTQAKRTAQKVTGQVIDEKGAGLPGVTISLSSGKPVGVSGEGGKFSVAVPDGQTILVFTFVGFEKKEVKITTGEPMLVSLALASNALQEVVLVGYGSQSKTKLASASSTVTAKDYKTAVVTTLDQALQGRATGVQVTQSSGEPGSDAVIRIRGNNSLSGDNQPLYVVDGFVMPPYVEASSNASGSLPQNGLAGINPNDIESITVLKDASATAIYGSRGSNGVILIKTKSGKANDQKIELVNKTSFGNITTPYKMADSKAYADLLNQSFVYMNVPAPFTAQDIEKLNSSTDWFKGITRNSLREDVSLNISGGSQKTTYFISGNYLMDKGVIKASQNNRASIRANINSDVTPWYTIRGQLSLSKQNTARAVSSSRSFPDNGGVILDALRASPIAPLDYFGYNGEGIPGFSGGYIFSNPLTELTQKTDKTLNDFTIVNFENVFKIIPGLQLNINLGSNQTLSRRQLFYPPVTAIGSIPKGTGSYNTSNTNSYNVNAYLNYIKDFDGGHNLNVTTGVEYNKQIVEVLNTSTSGYDIPKFGVYNIGSASIQSVGSARQDRTIQSAFLRTNYTYKDRYVLNASLRVDGASPFAENKKYGVFPAVGLAWNLNREDFMKNISWLTNTKIRSSYGQTGSQAIAPYSSLSQYGNAFYQTGASSTINTVLFPISLPNANLSWERTKQLNVGTDFSVLDNRLNVSFDYYDKRTEGLLQQRQLPSQTGFGSIIDNYGTMRNRGIELTLGATVIQGHNFSFDTRVTFSKNKNILLDLGEFTAPQYVGIGGNLLGGVSGILQPGKEIGSIYGERVIGLVQTGDIVNGVPNYPYPGDATNQVPGQWKYEDKNGDGKIDFDDAQVLGKSNPDFTYGWNNDIRYKNLGINLFFTGSQGNSVVNLTRLYLSTGIANLAGVYFNQTKDWYQNRWTPTNPTNDIRYPGVQKAISLSDVNNSYVENASFFRLKTASVYYDLNLGKFIKSARIFVTGTNLFTITKYTGADPEVSSFGQSILQQGIDYGSYPSYKTYTIGLSATF
ncbi:MAG: TonB-dependent receptor [Mucilaginibacter sp.]|nr:TonB-dependent receptor [Mucilaginibacter sp.]